MKQKITMSEITLVGLMAAMVYVSSEFLQFPIPTVMGNTRLHMGNVMCLLSGLLLGPVLGGLSAGIGSAFFDLTNPAYVLSAPFTFIFKFLMAFICGALYSKWKKKDKTVLYSFAASMIGSFIYIILYLSKNFLENYIFLQMPFQGVVLSITQKGVVSIINGITAVIVAVPISMAIRPAIIKILGNKIILSSLK